jgi:hypothetical protein
MEAQCHRWLRSVPLFFLARYQFLIRAPLLANLYWVKFAPDHPEYALNIYRHGVIGFSDVNREHLLPQLTCLLREATQQQEKVEGDFDLFLFLCPRT